MIIRSEKTNDFSVMSNVHLRDKRLSLKAKGLLSVILSLPNDWDYSMDGLVSICVEGKEAIVTATKELKLYGYMSITEERNAKGQFEYVWTFFETPKLDLPNTDKPNTAFPSTVQPNTDNPTQLNTNKLITKELNINNNKNTQKDQRFDSFWSAYPKKIGKSKCQDWFKKHKPSEELVIQMIQAINNQKNSTQWKKDAGQFIPHPLTWLNRGGWEDELEVSPSSTKRVFRDRTGMI